MPKNELTLRETAKALGCGTRTVDRLVDVGKLPKYKRAYGRTRVFFLREDIERLRRDAEIVKPKSEQQPVQVVES